MQDIGAGSNSPAAEILRSVLFLCGWAAAARALGGLGRGLR